MVGKVDNKNWQAAVALAKELHVWRRERVRGSQAPQPRTSIGESRGRGPLFGDDIVFNFDLSRPAEEDELDRAFPGSKGLKDRSTPVRGFNERIAAVEGAAGDGPRSYGDAVVESRGAALRDDKVGATTPMSVPSVGGKGKEGVAMTVEGEEVDAGWLYARRDKVVYYRPPFRADRRVYRER